MRFFILLPLLIFGCSKSVDTGATARQVPLVTKVTESTYLSGDQFCQKYSELTSKEIPLRVQVPKSYGNPSQGFITLYTYTNKAFDPSKPSYIYVDGGPGQNTHGLMHDYLHGEMNEIRFDQRGIGCSAAPTWSEYRGTGQYSTLNNARDLDEIRKAYGIEKWTVYGVSYGTVPSTVYGSMFSQHAQSIVLEGVVGPAELLIDPEFRVNKLNLVLAALAPAQREAFASLMLEDSEDSQALITNMLNFFYRDEGMAAFIRQLPRYIYADGTVNRAAFANLRAKMLARASEFPLPQQPGAVDNNILTTIYCKDLGARERAPRGLSFNGKQFYVKTYARNWETEDCDEQGVTVDQESLFRPEDYKTNVPVYYLQGAHDGATIAAGAYQHWQRVPQGRSYFLLATRGGHNPNLTRLESDVAATAAMETELFAAALQGADITQAMIATANLSQPADQAWVLYLSKSESIIDKLGGLHLVGR